MPIIKVSSRIEEYKYRALDKDINELTGRTSNPLLSKYIMSNICRRLSDINGTLVDVGCGDGLLCKTLLSDFQNTNFNYVGILPNREECERVSVNLSNLSVSTQIKQGLADSLPLEDNCASAVVVNGVILILDSQQDVINSLLEIRRISRVNAKVFIGEIPCINEFKDSAFGDSVFLWLIYVLRKKGLRQFISKLKFTLECIFTEKFFLIVPKKQLWFKVDDFLSILRECGFQIVDHYPHPVIDSSGRESLSSTRWDYLVRVIE